MPELRRLLIGDPPAAWAEAGFAIEDRSRSDDGGATTTLGTVAVRFVDGPGVGIVGWELAGEGAATAAGTMDGTVDGIATTVTDDPAPEPAVHPNGVSRLDHVVVATPDLARTIDALEGAGFETRRTRDVPGTDPVRRQVFLWAGEAILEVVGTLESTGDGPAALWGLALTTDDLDGAADLLGPRITTPKDAVQPGRRIATIDTRTLGIGPGLALMTPHVS